MESKLNPAKTQLVFKLEKNPDGFSYMFAEDCKFTIEKTDGPLYLNYEKRPERVVGFYNNLRQEGDLLLADIRLVESLTPIEERLEFSIEGAVQKNDQNEVKSVKVVGVSAIMHNKF